MIVLVTGGTGFFGNHLIKEFINMRLLHIYGPMDNNKFADAIFNALIKNQDVELTEGSQKRDFIYVEEAVNAFISVLECSKAECNQYYDVGTGLLAFIHDFVQMVKSISKSKSNLIFGKKKMRTNESMVSNISADISKLKELD